MIWNDRIRDLRRQHDMTLKDVAQRLQTTEATAQRYETSIKNIPYDVIEKYAKIFDVSPSYIMGWVDEENRHSFNEVTAHTLKAVDGHTYINPQFYHQREYDDLTKELLDTLDAMKPRDRVRVIDAILTLLNNKDIM